MFLFNYGEVIHDKNEDVYEDFSNSKNMFDFTIYSTKSKDNDDSNKSFIGKMEDETRSVAIEEFDDSSEHKKLK